MANNKSEWDYVGSNHVFRKRPPKKDDNGWIGVVILIVILGLVLSQCSG